MQSEIEDYENKLKIILDVNAKLKKKSHIYKEILRGLGVDIRKELLKYGQFEKKNKKQRYDLNTFSIGIHNISEEFYKKKDKLLEFHNTECENIIMKKCKKFKNSETQILKENLQNIQNKIINCEIINNPKKASISLEEQEFTIDSFSNMEAPIKISSEIGINTQNNENVSIGIMASNDKNNYGINFIDENYIGKTRQYLNNENQTDFERQTLTFINENYNKKSKEISYSEMQTNICENIGFFNMFNENYIPKSNEIYNSEIQTDFTEKFNIFNNYAEIIIPTKDPNFSNIKNQNLIPVVGILSETILSQKDKIQNNDNQNKEPPIIEDAKNDNIDLLDFEFEESPKIKENKEPNLEKVAFIDVEPEEQCRLVMNYSISQWPGNPDQDPRKRQHKF